MGKHAITRSFPPILGNPESCQLGDKYLQKHKDACLKWEVTDVRRKRACEDHEALCSKFKVRVIP